ncbi:UNVERIFIED_CONTAM: Splicing factor U2af small subunit B [Sesamum latifolium]|uniref:Splicing factor U2af small subunit B n=1 Tax=Sesamum latifolium TaxID=2727402 RepID=A0AAW2VSV5_9LAMI
MAEHLASIFGTEKDRVNCPFYFKIGACRHGDRCSRLHNRPAISPTLLLSNMYQRPDMITPGVDAQGQPIDPHKIQEHFEDFYEDIFEELSKFGEIETLNVCDNLADHMIGNVYVQFKEEDQAAAALNALQGRELRRKLFGRHHGRFWGKRSRSRSVSPPQHYHRRERERERRGIMRGGIIVVGEGGVEVIDTGEGMRVKGEGMEVVQGGAGVQPSCHEMQISILARQKSISVTGFALEKTSTHGAELPEVPELRSSNYPAGVREAELAIIQVPLGTTNVGMVNGQVGLKMGPNEWVQNGLGCGCVGPG